MPEVFQTADIVILGEVHDNPVHHRIQADYVAALAPRAVVFEMFGPDAAAQAMSVSERTEPALAEALGWGGSGWPAFSMYWPIFAAAPPDVPLVGAALPRDDVRRAVTDGAEAVFDRVFGSDADLYGLNDALDPETQAARQALQLEAHCNALPEQMLPGMVEAQRLRDAGFARAAVDALTTYGAPVVVITGNGHARKDWGIPAVLAQVAPEVSVATLGLFEVAATAQERARYDGHVITPAADRDDPCAAFR